MKRDIMMHDSEIESESETMATCRDEIGNYDYTEIQILPMLDVWHEAASLTIVLFPTPAHPGIVLLTRTSPSS